jgi:hypothetical protein
MLKRITKYADSKILFVCTLALIRQKLPYKSLPTPHLRLNTMQRLQLKDL